MKKRTFTIIAAGVVEILFGLFLLLFSSVQGNYLLISEWPGKVLVIVVFLIALSLIICGVGVLLLKEWARKMTLIVCYILIVLAALVFLFNIFLSIRYYSRGGIVLFTSTLIGMGIFLSPIVGMCIVFRRPKIKMKFMPETVVDGEEGRVEIQEAAPKAHRPRSFFTDFTFERLNRRDWAIIIVGVLLLAILSLLEIL